ncbi:MliC family protein [Xinfangfangia sp. CPCC 101601]|uniref:MliC family protein n=1 Tax=Pseudogemmobacter lacusdianii TaxID=3069608 RepID=A0ABU0VUX9_9RHOB|nr:MliC family protein [Xinfangfangia sp. CPCC 101601]MDQ2065532.1 MliC family protein [Xinfangfangia sp. CPCC 101601]
MTFFKFGLSMSLMVAAAPAVAQTELGTLRYICDRDVEIPVTYVTASDLQVAVLTVEVGQITLLGEPSASGARYGWPSDGANYVWWSKGTEATLLWKEGGQETVLLNCVEM